MNYFTIYPSYLLLRILWFCSPTCILNLKLTNKELYSQIPTEWCMSRLVIQDEWEIYHSRYPFLVHLYYLHSKIERIRITQHMFSALRDITLIQTEYLTQIDFEPLLTSVDSILINIAPNLAQLAIPSEYNNLKAIFISNCKISTLTIHPTWSLLKILVLIGLEHLTSISIPKQCDKIDFINLSRSGITRVYLYSKLSQALIIQAIGNTQVIHLYTHSENFEHILSPSLIFLKTLDQT
jgi:hypothetical protein